jgi:hypothetical protein
MPKALPAASPILGSKFVHIKNAARHVGLALIHPDHTTLKRQLQ